ncbi:MAG: single-stranded-DNA-specific exonuclease RecJ [Bacteroidetes bacterium]|nr:single-stranded-DNA-specific exonuclease RecJ [Bacteroidota bacterium]
MNEHIVSNSKYKWTFLNHIAETDLKLFAEQLNITETLARILMNRGIVTFDTARDFFRPSTDQLYDPFLMKDMDVAVERLVRAYNDGDKIMIYGDYDVDGTTGTALLYSYFRDIKANVSYYINDRIKEGYGIARSGIDHAHSMGVKIIISVDCGITAVSQAEYCREKGIDLIICDHHTVGDNVPKALAILNPKRPDCHYPFKDLCGCGVGFKLTQGVSKALGIDPSIAERYMDLVGVAVAADIVPLIDENRTITRLGLDIIQQSPRPCWIAMEKKTGLTLDRVNSSQIVFSIGPRINAVGRLGDAKRAVQMMVAETVAEAADYASVLESENTNRKTIDEDNYMDAGIVAEKFLRENSGLSIVLHNEKWHPGVIGIVASRLVEKHYRPAVMMTTIEGVAKGSARSIPGFDVYEAIKACEEFVIQFGGHKYAAGLSVKLENIPAFQAKFDEVVKQTLTADLLTPEIQIDSQIDFSEITDKFWKVLRQFQPHGPDNLRPVFYSDDVEIIGYPSVVGKGHLKFKAKQKGSPVFDVIGYNMESYYTSAVASGKALHMVYSINENVWNGQTQLQLQLKDLK